MSVPRIPNFNEPETPATLRATGFVNVLISVLSTLPGLFLVTIIAEILIATVVSRPLRDGHAIWLGIVFIVIFFLAWELRVIVIGWALFSKWYDLLSVGKPRFPIPKSIRNQVFNFGLRCVDCVDLRFDPEAEDSIRRIGAKQLDVTEEIYSRIYRDTDFPPSTWPDAWQQIKEAQIKGAKSPGASFGEAISSGRLGIFLDVYNQVFTLVSPFFIIYAAGIFWFSANVAGGGSPLPLAQFALAVGFVTALIIFINLTARLRILTFLPDEESSELPSLREVMLSSSAEINEKRQIMRWLTQSKAASELTSEARRVAGKYYPAVSIESGYIDAIRNRFSRAFFTVGMFSAIGLALLILIQWPLSLAFSHWPSSQVDSWTVRMLTATASMPLAFLAAFTLGLMVLVRFRRFVGILVAGILTAAIPPLITYILQGSVGNTVLLSSLITAAISALGAAIAEVIKARAEVKARPSSRPGVD